MKYIITCDNPKTLFWLYDTLPDDFPTWGLILLYQEIDPERFFHCGDEHTIKDLKGRHLWKNLKEKA